MHTRTKNEAAQPPRKLCHPRASAKTSEVHDGVPNGTQLVLDDPTQGSFEAVGVYVARELLATSTDLAAEEPFGC
jgi:hypothetical protein